MINKSINKCTMATPVDIPVLRAPNINGNFRRNTYNDVTQNSVVYTL